MKKCKVCKVCRVCREKTKDYKKINNIKIYLCTDKCKITYVLKRFLDKNYNYNNHYGYVSLNIT